MARLEVDIDANVKGLQSSIDQAVKVATKLGNPFEKTTGVINTLNQRISILKKNLESATDIKSITSYNRRLKETQEELAKIRSAGVSGAATVKIDTRDVLRLTKELDNANKKLLQLETLDPDINLNSATNSVNRLNQSINNSAKAAQNARPAYNGIGIEFSRIIQDAPYVANNFGAIGNNVTRLAEVFSDVRRQSASTGEALKTALMSIVSPANLVVLGISAAVSAFTLYSMGAFDSKEKTKDLKSETDLLNEAFERLEKNLDSLAKSQLNSSINSEQELASMKLLVGIINDSNQTNENRLAAFNRLKEQYPAFLKNISTEKSLTSDLTKEYEALSKAIIERASILAIEEEIIEVVKNKVQLTKQLEKADKDAFLIQQQRLKAEQQIARERELIASGEVKGTARLKRAQEELDAINELGNTAEGVYSLISGKLKENSIAVSNLTGQYNSLNQSVLSLFDFDDKDIKDPLEEFSKIADLNNAIVIREWTEETNRFNKELAETERIINSLENISIGIAASLDKPLQEFEINFNEADFDEKVNAFDQKIIDAGIRFQNTLAGFNESLGMALSEGIAMAIGDVAFAIGEALGNGSNVLQAAGGALLGSLAAILNQLGQLAISTGVAILGIKLALKTLNPFVAIAAGTALVALAGFVSSKAKSLGGSMGSGGGGNVSSGGASQNFGGAGLGFAANQNQNYRFILEGTTLVATLDTTRDRFAKG